MPLIDDILPIIDSGYTLVQNFGVTKYSVRIVRREWDSGETGLGNATDSTHIAIAPNPERKEVRDGVVRLGPIIPKHVSGGYTHDELNPRDEPGVEYWYEVTGPSGDPERYHLLEIDDSESYQYFITLGPLSLAGPE